jgi:hypothetical protein
VVDQTWTASVLQYLGVPYETKALKDVIWNKTPVSFPLPLCMIPQTHRLNPGTIGSLS